MTHRLGLDSPQVTSRSLRLTHVTHWPLPSDDTATIQLVQTLSALAELGVDAELLFPRPPWRAGRDPDTLRRELAEHYGAPCRFAPRELPTRLPPLPGLSRLLHAGLAARATARSPAVVVHTRDLETAWMCLAAGRQVLFESFRIWTRRSSFHRTRLLRMGSKPRFLGLVTHSRYAADRYIEDGFPATKVRAIHNGFDPGSFAVARAPSEARRALGIPDLPTVGFLGVIALHKRVDLLLDAAERTPELRWVLAGDPTLPEARGLVERGRELPNVDFPGYVTGDRLALVLQAADVLVIPPSSAPLQQFGHTVLPIKVFQYLAAGRAIVAGETPDTAELLVHDRNCVRIRPDDATILAATLRSLVEDPDRRARLGSAARRDSAELTWGARAEAFLRFLRARTGNGQ